MSNEQRIRRRAHDIWEREGRPEGRQEDHWAQACREIATEEDGTSVAASSSSVDQDLPSPPQMPMSGALGGQFGGKGAVIHRAALERPSVKAREREAGMLAPLAA